MVLKCLKRISGLPSQFYLFLKRFNRVSVRVLFRLMNHLQNKHIDPYTNTVDIGTILLEQRSLFLKLMLII